MVAICAAKSEGARECWCSKEGDCLTPIGFGLIRGRGGSACKPRPSRNTPRGVFIAVCRFTPNQEYDFA